MQDISLETNWLELKKISLGSPTKDAQTLTIADLLEWIENANSWNSIVCKIKLALRGKGWLNSDFIEATLQRLPWEKLERIRALIGSIQKNDSVSFEDSIQMMNQIELLNNVMQTEKIRREHNAEKTLMFFDHISLENLMKTSLYEEYAAQASDFGKVINPNLIKRSFFQFLKEQLVSGDLDQEKLVEFDDLLNNSDHIIYDIVKHEYNRLINIENVVATYKLILKDDDLTHDSELLLKELLSAFEILQITLQGFYSQLFDTAQQDDRVNAVAKLFQSQEYRNYTNALSGVTRLYFKFLKHEKTMRESLSKIEKKYAEDNPASWELMAPLAYFKVVPSHRNQLENLLAIDSEHQELGATIEAVQNIQARWFNH